MTYETAVKNAIEGRNDGFQFLYESTYRDKYYIALKYMKNEADAQDVLQDAYVKAFSRLETLQDAKAFPCWLGQIVANTAKNALVKKNPLLFSEMNVNTDSEEKWEDQIEDENREYRPEEAYTQQETQTIVHEMIESLSDEQRICVLMYYLEEQSVKSIADALGCSENTVKSRLNYGRKNLKCKAEEMQKKGYRLYSIVPLPLLLYLLRSERKLYAAAQIPAWNQGVKNSINGAGSAPSSAPSSANGAIRIFLHTAAGKVTAAVLGVAVLGAVSAGVILSQKHQDDTTANVIEAQQDQTDTPTDTPTDTEQEVPAETEGTDQETAWMMLFEDKLDEIRDNEDTYRASLSEWDQNADISYRYALFDLNADGTPEMIVSTDVNGWGTCACYMLSEDGNSVTQLDIEEPIYDGAAATGGSRAYILFSVEKGGIYDCNYYSYSPDVDVYLYELSGDKMVRTAQENYTTESTEQAEVFAAFKAENVTANWVDIEYPIESMVGSEQEAAGKQ